MHLRLTRNNPHLLRSLALVFVFAVGCVGVASAQTVAIPGLYATGVDNSGNRLGGNDPDPHYVVTAKPAAAPANNLGTSRTVNGNAIATFWVGNPTTSRWITTPGTPSSGSGSGGQNPFRETGNYDYTLTFTMPAGAILSTVAISGVGAADNSATIYVNGVLVSGQSITTYGSTNSFSLTGANASFQTGTNTITFRVNNNINNTGLLITSLSGTVSVPEVGAVLPILGAIGLYGLVIVRRRKTSG